MVATARKAKKKIEDAVRYALGHKTRVEILIILNMGVYTTAQLAEIIGESHSGVGNHIRKMLDDGSIEIAKEERRGNIVQYWYKAVEIPIYSKEEAEAMTPFQRQVTVGAIVQSGSAEVFAALDAGKLADPSSILFWHWYNLDAQGQEELDIESHRYLDRIREIEGNSANRCAQSDEVTTSMLVNLSVFERARKATTA